MQTTNYAQNTVKEVVEHIPEATDVLRQHHIEATPTQSVPLYHAAQYVSASTDEMLAVMEYRMRHAARNRK